jgi:hypothetical protein
MATNPPAPAEPTETRCAECGRLLAADETRIETEDGAFCTTCFENLKAQLRRAIQTQSSDINYPTALVGGVLGGVLGALVWWGFTVITSVSFGLVAIVIGIAVGKGVTIFSGHKRARGLQALSAAVALVSFFYASYLVTRTFILRALAEAGQEGTLPLFPDPELWIRVVSPGFQMFDLVFLAIVLWQAWKIPAPVRLAP